MIDPSEELIDELILSVGKKSIYRIMQVPSVTLRDLASKALKRQPSKQMALKTMRRKLHQITAPYLGDPIYPQSITDLKSAFESRVPGAIEKNCQQILAQHTSTRERLLILDDFYRKIFKISGTPDTLIDLACGLNPLTLRWMDLPADGHYLAYDIHAPRVELINTYFRLEGYNGQAALQDILVDPPPIAADIAFLFKEAHRFEEREKGCNRALWKALNVAVLCVSLPPMSMTGRHDLAPRNRKLVFEIAGAEGWQITEVAFANEQVFVIKK